MAKQLRNKSLGNHKPLVFARLKRAELQTRNWEPSVLPRKLGIVSAWMSNIQAMLIYALGGDAAEAQFKFLSSADEYREPWNVSNPVPNFSMTTCEISKAPTMTADRILASYKN